jgi:hypothetical protein
MACFAAMVLVFLSLRPQSKVGSATGHPEREQSASTQTPQAQRPQPRGTNPTTTPTAPSHPADFASAVARVKVITPAAPDSVREPAFAAFHEWVTEFRASTPEQRTTMEERGVALAAARKPAMYSLLARNPDRALELAVPNYIQRRLPQSISALLEKQVSAKGDLEVLGALPLPNAERAMPSIQRFVALPGREKLSAFPSSKAPYELTKSDIPLNVLTLGDRAVLDEPVRRLSADEAAEIADTAQADPICSTSGDNSLAADEPTPVEVAGNVHWMCRYEHSEQMSKAFLAAAGLPTGPSASNDGTAESNYTEGRKRIIVFRVAFPNVPTPSLTVLAGNQMLTNMNNLWHTMSYGRTTVAMPGQGSDVVLVTLTQNTSVYDGDAAKLRADVRAAATANGIDLSKYDFDVTCVGSQPAYTFAGLAYVGAPGAWLANGYFGTATAAHEFGHNLGAPHANFWDTGGQSAIGPGANDEYGDPYDVMGGAGAPQGHYVAKFKWRIGWISDADFPRINTSGRYRIYSHDNFDARGLRGLRFARNGSMDYYVEFRQLFTGNNWLMNGLKLNWGNSGTSWGSQLIDTTPGSANGKNDSPILIGQTFSDTNAGANVHITPLAKGNTYPQSMDVVVNFGTFASNRPPLVQLTASSTNVSLNTSVTLTAHAADPNGDALAYFWDFDDGTYSVNNSAVQTKSFSTAGDYNLRCVVSDMKGERTTKTLLIRVGSPNTFTISGRVLDNHRPVEGALVRAGSRLTYSSSDGTYALTRLAAGSHTVTAALYPFQFVNPWSANPVVVGPSAVNIDFVNIPGGIQTTTLLATGSVWRYLDDGSDQSSTGWTSPGFSDITWSNGLAQLGYGDDDEATVVRFGSDPANKHITTYFRKQFSVPDPSAVTNLVLRLLRDDGGVVYLNGVEVFRDNMPAGTIGYRTPAVNTTEGTWVQTSLPQSALVAGNNVVAVEVHQVQPDSSDMSFDLEIVGQPVANNQRYSALYVSTPSEGASFTGPTNLTVSANAFFSGDSFTLVEFFANGVKFGESASAPYSATWLNASVGTHALTVRGRVASGGFQTSAPVSVTITSPAPPIVASATVTNPPASRVFTAPANIALGASATADSGQAVSRVEFYADGTKVGEDLTLPYAITWNNAPLGTFAVRAVVVQSGGSTLTSAPVSITITSPPNAEQLIARRSSWRYLDDGTDPGSSWTARTFNDSAWAEGYARLGYGGDGETTVVNFGGDEEKRFITTYFRSSFVLAPGHNISGLRLNISRDDGVVVYLNGTEVHRTNLLAGPVSHNSLALAAVSGADETNFFSIAINAAPLVTGTNVLAIEVHQSTINSSDLGLDAELIAERATNVAGAVACYLTAPADGTHVTLPASVTLSVFTHHPGQSAVTSVEYFANGTSVGVANTAPFSLNWNPPTGNHTLTARATLANATTADAPPISISVDGPPAQVSPVFETFIPLGAAWKYWSNGVTPAGDWTARDFNDDAWFTGNAKFGWGLDGEVTLLPSGRTHYFRKSFVVQNPALLESLIVQLQRDDGAVVYLNGIELFRSNMPPGIVTSTTLANATVDALEEQTYFISEFPAVGLIAGTNVLAVELHQSSTTSSDAGFDLQLNGAGTTARRIVLGAPANNQFFVTPANVPVEAYVSIGSGRTVAAVEFFEDGAKLGEATAEPFRFTWTNAPLGLRTLVARALDNFGAAITSAPVRFSVGHPPVSLVLVPSNSVWKYYDNSIAPPATWLQTNFNEAGWSSGAAELGYGDLPDGRPEATVLCCSNAAVKTISYYFRRQFVVPENHVITNLTFRLVRDDGAVVYLNGRELYRSNMPAGVVQHSTLASAAANGASEAQFFVTTLGVTNLFAGTNLVAVEVHQNANNSSDVSFNLQVEGFGYVLNTNAPPSLATRRGGGFELAWPSSASGYQVFHSPVLGPGANWQPVTVPTQTSNGTTVLRIETTNGSGYFRLQR